MKKTTCSFWRLWLPVLLLGGLSLAACSKTVTVVVPPRVDLHAMQTVGVIDFAAQPPGDLTQEATQKFLGNLQAAQPGVRLLELGSREKVLHEIGRSDLDYQAIREIGAHYGIQALLSGTVELSEPRPDLKISPTLTAMTAQAKIDGKMSAKLWETSSGATVWTNSSWGDWAVGGVSITDRGTANVGYQDPREKRGEILMALIKALNGDFWPTYAKRKVEQ